MIRFPPAAHVAVNNTRGIIDLQSRTECQKKCSSKKKFYKKKFPGPRQRKFSLSKYSSLFLFKKWN